MPYDLYGNSYKSAREAEAAEMAQVNEIDNRINDQRIRQLEQQQQYPNAEIWQYIQMLEDKIKTLEEKVGL
jgi:hypothetical protein